MDDDPHSIGLRLRTIDNLATTIDALSQAVAAQPNNAELHCDLAITLQNAGQLDRAAEHYRRAVEIDPLLRRAWYNLGCLYNADGREAEAVGCFRRSIELEPQHAPSHHNLGQALFNLGDTDGAIEQYRRAIALGAGRLSQTMLAMTIGVSPSADPATILEARRGWGDRYLPKPIWQWHRTTAEAPAGAPLAPSLATEVASAERSPWERVAESPKKLRIGYVSAFFDRPNWMKPVWALINRHDRQRFELFLYSDIKPHQVPSGYRPEPRDQWRWTADRSHVEMAGMIADDRLDLLVDLNGFSRLPRLEVFALRPSPVQAAWFNMFATSGTTAFDFLIGDETVLGVRAKQNGGPSFVSDPDYSERLVPLAGCYLTFEVNHPTSEVVAAPFQSRGHFTFGSLASLYKITPQVVELWSRILRECPESRLLLRNSGIRSASNRAWFEDLFVRHGLDAKRLTFLGPADHLTFLRTYDEIDLALDTFPYNGGTTTTEAIWQGVPVVAMHGNRWTSRVSSSLLSNAGLGDFVAADVEGYVRLAVSTATEPTARERLAQLRLSLRDQLRRSSVCDAGAFTRRMETAYRAMLSAS